MTEYLETISVPDFHLPEPEAEFIPEFPFLTPEEEADLPW